MNNKNPPLSIFKVWLFGLVFSSILTLLNPFVTNAQLISPRISLTSSQEPAGITINIHGNGFSAGSTATLYAKNPDGSQSGILSMGILPDGSFNTSHLFPTGYPPGTYLLWVVDGPTGRYSNRINFNMPATQSTETRMPLPPYLPAYTPQHGDLIRAKGDTKIYLIHNVERRAIVTEEVFKQMGFKLSDVKDIDPQDMMSIPEGPPIWRKEIIASFPEGTLIRLKGKPQTYVIQGGRKCYIPDTETFHTRGYRWDQVREVDQTTLDSIVTGIPLQSVKPPFQYHPPGQPPPPVIQPPPTGLPPPIQPQPLPYQQPSPWQPPPGSSSIPPSTGPTQFQLQPSFFSDGTLIKGSGPDIYLIENGVRRLIPDMETFNAMGFNWGSVINVEDQKLGSLPSGLPIPQKRRSK
ncbi:MAG: hypothetical protein KG012_11475 [Deltaproteobacteria bacterium]|nr:hypothetical protein [Deltaproteobacteria bacterium]